MHTIVKKIRQVVRIVVLVEAMVIVLSSILLNLIRLNAFPSKVMIGKMRSMPKRTIEIAHHSVCIL
jgi:hypothetical protein